MLIHRRTLITVLTLLLTCAPVVGNVTPSLAQPASETDRIAPTAKSYQAKIKCAVMTLKGYGTNEYIYGYGKGRTEKIAMKNAWNDMQRKVPRGHKAKHCHYVFAGAGSSSRFAVTP